MVWVMVGPESLGMTGEVRALMNSVLGSASSTTTRPPSTASILETLENAETRGVPSFSDPAQRSRE